MLTNLVLLTNDVHSSHTFKRAMFLSSFFNVIIIGFQRKNTSLSTSLPINIRTIVIGEARDKKYLSRLRLYRKLQASTVNISPSVIFARGSDMVLIALLSRKKKTHICAEVTDIYEISFRKFYSKVYRIFEKQLYRSVDLVFSTSPAFFHFYKIPKEKQILWENYYTLNWNEENQHKAISLKIESIKQDGKFNIVQTGYFRCQETIGKLTSKANEFPNKMSFHLHGFANGGGFDDDFLLEQVKKGNGNVIFHGKYNYNKDLPHIFAKAHFTIVTEHHPMNFNSTLNLTNRIYESIAHYTPCLAIGKGAIYDYIKSNKLGVAFENYEDFTIFFSSLDEEKYKDLIENIDFNEYSKNIDRQQTNLKEAFKTLKK